MCRLFIGADPALWESVSRSVRIDGVVTSVRLERFFWDKLGAIAERDGLSVTQLISRLYRESIDAGHDLGNFTSFLRVCCGRFLALQADGDIPPERAISGLDARAILERERRRAAAALHA